VDLVFSAHALARLARRRIDRNDVETVLLNPARTEVRGSAVVYDGVARGRILRVVVALGSEPTRVITAYPRRRLQ
jgi:hypothetical protein